MSGQSHMADMLADRNDTIRDLRNRVRALEATLRELASAKVNSAIRPGEYRDGVVFGLDHCATVARNALTPAETPAKCTCLLHGFTDPACPVHPMETPDEAALKSEPEHQAQMKWARDVVSNVIIPPACSHDASRLKDAGWDHCPNCKAPLEPETPVEPFRCCKGVGRHNLGCVYQGAVHPDEETGTEHGS